MSTQDLELGDLNINIFRLKRRLNELGESDESKADLEEASASVLKREVARLEKKLQKIEKPQAQERKDDIIQRFAGSDNVSVLTRRALFRCVTLAEAQKLLGTMRSKAETFGDPAGLVFTAEDIDGAVEKCQFEFSRRALDEADPEDEVEAAQEDGKGKQKGKRGRKPKAEKDAKPSKRQAKASAAKVGDDAEDEEPDLDGEQNIDLDIELDAKEMRGLIDMFESPPAPVDDDWRRCWKGPLPTGSWIADDRALLGRLAKRGIGASADLMGRLPGPGQHSFNSYITARLQHAGINVDMTCEPNPKCPPLQPHQLSVAFLLHPASPIERLLVDHPTGCGKTREMIAVLDSYFHDPRPKVPIFPTDAVCRNFYIELLRWPSKYRDFFCCEEPEMAQKVAGLEEGSDWRPVRQHSWSLAGVAEADLRLICTRYRECLEMQGTFVTGKLRKGRRHHFRSKNPGEDFPAAPLRALGYTSAGGSNIKLDTLTGFPLSSLFKVGFQKAFDNVYNRKIVLMDEVHNLVRSNTRYQQQLQVLRRKLATADECVLVGFTATPIPNERSEGRLLLDTIKGDLHLGLFDEGFISSFPFKPPHLFPKCFPPGVPDTPLTPAVQDQLCRRVELCGEALLSYDLHARDPDVKGKQLQVYCNMFSFGSTFHDGAMGCKAQVMARPDALAPKLMTIVQEVSSPENGERTKALVLISRRSGYNAIVALMQRAGRESTPPFNVATMEQLSEFNAPENARGDRFLVLIADSAECGEGISFKAVRRQYMADVPESPAAFIQYCGRANRMYGHQVLDPEERTLCTAIYTAVLPQWMQGDALSVWCYRVFGRRGSPSAEAERLARELRSRFTEVDVNSLIDLKDKLDVFATLKFQKVLDELEEATSKRAKKPKGLKLNTQDIADFFEGLGMLDEAQSLRPLQGADVEDEASGDEAEASAPKDGSDETAAQAEPRAPKDGSDETPAQAEDDAQEAAEASADSKEAGGQGEVEANEATDALINSKTSSSSDSMLTEASTAESPHEPEPSATTNRAEDSLAVDGKQALRDIAGDVAMDPRKSIRTLARSVLKLFADSRAGVTRTGTLAKETEDERAVRSLRKLYEEFLPALSSMRNSAVDKMVLSHEEDRQLLERAAASDVKPAAESASSDVQAEPSTVDESVIDSMLRVLEQAKPESVQPAPKASAKAKAKAAAKRKQTKPEAEACDTPEAGSESMQAAPKAFAKAAAKKKQAKPSCEACETPESGLESLEAAPKASAKAAAKKKQGKPAVDASDTPDGGLESVEKTPKASAKASTSKKQVPPSVDTSATPARKRARKA